MDKDNSSLPPEPTIEKDEAVEKRSETLTLSAFAAGGDSGPGDPHDQPSDN